jgi:hypothetical protein
MTQAKNPEFKRSILKYRLNRNWHLLENLLYCTQGSILENTPPTPGGGKYQPMTFGGKNMKRQREKGGKCERKRKKGERK